ncbi:sodium channel modifier 1-like [Dromaius novaehollandiae]|uniref:sodium channel modifier 1 n=1 Tax=Dromaius novaehollandiae TaxID=8790 RepID=UPI00311F44E6
MSFKREGDDPGQLGVLQKRRVADLLANYIPEDEALLLRSGRYTCTVCAHRPIFDTLDVLAVHRTGKKHIASLQSFYGRKRSLENEVQKRQHEEFVRAEEAGTQGSPAPLLVRTKKIAQSALLKAAPYSSRHRRMGADRNSSRVGTTRIEPSAAPACVAAMVPLEPGVSSQRDREAVDTTSAALLPGHCSRQADTPKAAAAQTQRGGKGKASPSPASQPEALSPKRCQALQRYLQLRSAGWIQDRSGKWVKDENAEFDSDEDEPPVLLPA